MTATLKRTLDMDLELDLEPYLESDPPAIPVVVDTSSSSLQIMDPVMQAWVLVGVGIGVIFVLISRRRERRVCFQCRIETETEGETEGVKDKTSHMMEMTKMTSKARIKMGMVAAGVLW
jgi:hypothetical protein